MKYYLTLVVCLLALALKAEANCNFNCDGIYGSVLGGVNFLQIDKASRFKLDEKAGFLAGAAVGYKFNPYFRAEIELAYRGNKVKQKQMGTFNNNLWTLMGNGYLEYPLAYGITPYIGLGTGYGWNHVKFKGHKDNTNGFVWQAIAGARYQLCERTDIALDYRYMDGQKDANNHAICLSLIQSF